MPTPFVAVETKLNKWPQVIQRFPAATSAIVGKVTHDAYARSQLTVPVRRPDVEEATGITGGFLKQSGQPVFHRGAHEGEVRYTAYYAGYVHEGTVHMAARPFLADAVHALMPSMIAAFKQLEGMLL